MIWFSFGANPNLAGSPVVSAALCVMLGIAGAQQRELWFMWRGQGAEKKVWNAFQVVTPPWVSFVKNSSKKSLDTECF